MYRRRSQLWSTILWWILPQSLYRKLKDNCEICLGNKGGVLGNENIVTTSDGPKIMCDYCSAAFRVPKEETYRDVVREIRREPSAIHNPASTPRSISEAE